MKNRAAAAIDAADQPPTKLNLGFELDTFFYFEEKSCCSCCGRYISSNNRIESWILNLKQFFISRKNRAADAMDATDHPPIELNLGV